jgi:hypothetical protein
MQLVAQQRAGCKVDPQQPGDYQGTCKCSNAEGGAVECGKCEGGNRDGGDSCASQLDVSSEKLREMEELAGVATSTASSGDETHDTQGSSEGEDEVCGFRLLGFGGLLGSTLLIRGEVQGALKHLIAITDAWQSVMTVT